MEYLGNKAGLLSHVVAAVEGGERRRRLRVLDAFCGTSVVAKAMRNRGHFVHANDHLALCAAWASAALLVPNRPTFVGLERSVLPPSSRPYEHLVTQLNSLPPVKGFIARNFSPLSAQRAGVERRYFTVDNAGRIDAIRGQIKAWESELTSGERGLLLSTLLAAVIGVSNTAGTYGCYLKGWKPKALQPLLLRPLQLPVDNHVSHEVTCKEALSVAAEAEVDVLYADPPYTKRQYAAYYHVLETLVQDDEPELVGSTGLRPWQSQASDWCYKRRAPGALEALIAKACAPRIVLSYSEDGHIDHEFILELLRMHGSVAYREVKQRRYRSSQLPHKGTELTERIYSLERL
jgi:adenine-specific DNA-methyltransferase